MSGETTRDVGFDLDAYAAEYTGQCRCFHICLTNTTDNDGIYRPHGRQ